MTPYILSAHFSMAEFTYSQTAIARGIDNNPPLSVVPLAKEFCEKILEPIRERFGPVVIQSGYRCHELNAAVLGTARSQHIWHSVMGVAVDFRCPHAKLEEVFAWLTKESHLPFDQVILEYGKIPDSSTDDCIHISYRPEPRRMALKGETHNRSAYVPVEVA